jgi:cell wall-associated NlpC family hydrolase
MLMAQEGNLQAHFELFRKKRTAQIKARKVSSKAKVQERSTQAFRDNLRHKFITQVASYIGIPYAKRYIAPDDPEYNSPLFLDCCALVRHAVNDLKNEFGFTLGRWNQGYQYDMLAEEIPFEALCPGDLIFYSAKFYDPRRKVHKHNMVHVEVFIGGSTGEATIGSRSRQHVSKHESFRLESENYYDTQYHFKSIEPWLEGKLQSYCSEHNWVDVCRKAKRKSVFKDS